MSYYFPATPKPHFAEGGWGGNLFPPHLADSVLLLLLVEFGWRSLEVGHALGVGEVELEVGLRRVEAGFDRGQPGVRDWAERQAGMQVSVVGRVQGGVRLAGGLPLSVEHRSVDLQLRSVRQAVVVNAAHRRPIRIPVYLALDDRSEDDDVVDTLRRPRAGGLCGLGPQVVAEDLVEPVELSLDQVPCSRRPVQQVGVGEEESLQAGA